MVEMLLWCSGRRTERQEKNDKGNATTVTHEPTNKIVVKTSKYLVKSGKTNLQHVRRQQKDIRAGVQNSGLIDLTVQKEYFQLLTAFVLCIGIGISALALAWALTFHLR